jgi:hypothetical protein
MPAFATADVGAAAVRLFAGISGEYGVDLVADPDNTVAVLVATSKADAEAARAALTTPTAGTVAACFQLKAASPPLSLPGRASVNAGTEIWAIAATGTTPQRVSGQSW